MTVYVSSPKPLPLPKLVSVPVVTVLSVLVFVVDAMAIFIAGVRVHTLEAWAMAVAVMLPLTLYTAYCWKGGFTYSDYVELGPRRRNSGAVKGKKRPV